jgi:hypothetical protein
MTPSSTYCLERGGHKFVPAETINLPPKGGSVFSEGNRVISIFCERCGELIYLGDHKNGKV